MFVEKEKIFIEKYKIIIKQLHGFLKVFSTASNHQTTQAKLFLYRNSDTQIFASQYTLLSCLDLITMQ